MAKNRILFKCDECEHVMKESEMLTDEFALDIDMLVLGNIIPSGRCLKCEGYCFPLILDLATARVLKAIHAVWDALSDFVEEPADKPLSVTELHKAGVRAIAKLQKALPLALHKTKEGR